jgi:hypothetical protein
MCWRLLKAWKENNRGELEYYTDRHNTPNKDKENVDSLLILSY